MLWMLSSLIVNAGTVTVPGFIDRTLINTGCSASRTFFSPHMASKSLQECRDQAVKVRLANHTGYQEHFTSSLTPCDTRDGGCPLGEASETQVE